MLTVTSKSEFPYAEGREFGWQLDMQDSNDKPQSILMEAVCHKIIIFFIKPSDSNLRITFVCVSGSYLKPKDKYWSWLVEFRRCGVSVGGLSEYFIDLWRGRQSVFCPLLH